ncbi:MAG: WhiB family transcriptional regulator [Acidobacteria bacterium]|nr:WhiB family transcriptional regulator [Acidobacteriota bacterium]
MGQFVTGDNPALDGIRAATEGGTVGLPDLEVLLGRPDWHRDAACLEHPELSWFPARGDNAGLVAAIAVCRRCLVRAECLQFALETPDTVGVWGGTTARQRAALRREGIALGTIVRHVGPKAADQRKRLRGKRPGPSLSLGTCMTAAPPSAYP